MLLRTVFALLALTLIVGEVPAQASVSAQPLRTVQPFTKADLDAWLDAFVPTALAKGDIAGLVISVVKDGALLTQRGYGVANVRLKTPMDPEHTVIRVASVSKAFTATAVMQLVEQGKLDLDRDVNAYLDFTIPPAFGAPITLRHLLTHTAGFEETPYKRYRPPLSLRQHLTMVPDRLYAPGTIPAYSNYGATLAGYIVARAAGASIVDVIERGILQPLGMHSSSFRMSLPAPLESRAAKLYPRASSGEPFPPELVAEMSPAEAPASALATTAHDMAAFMLAQLQEGRVDSARVLTTTSVNTMHAPSFIPMPGAQPVALGLFRADYHGHRVIGHSGDGEGAHAEMKLLPDDHVGVFLAVNSDGAESGFLPAAFSLRAELFEQFVDRYLPPVLVPQEPSAATAREHAALVAGEYAWSRQQKGDFQEAIGMIGRFALGATVVANDDGTITTPAYLTFEKNGRSQRWREVAPFVWREVDGDARFFATVKEGRVTSVWTDQAPSFWVGLAVPALRSARLNIPLLLASTLVLVVATLAWPVVALVRRRRNATATLSVDERRRDRLAHLAAAAGLVYMLGWSIALGADFASTVGAEKWIRVIQAIGLLVIVGAGVAVWRAWRESQGTRGLGTRVWSLVVAFALLDVVWFSLAFRLMSVRMN